MIDNKVLALSRPAPPPSVIESQLLGAVLALGEPHSLIELSGMHDNDFSDSRVSTAWMICRHIAAQPPPSIVDAETVWTFGRSRNLLGDGDRAWLRDLQAANLLNRDSFAQNAVELRNKALGCLAASRLEAQARLLRSGDFKGASVSAEINSISDSLVRMDLRGETAATDILELEAKWEERERTGRSPMMRSGITLLDKATGHKEDGSDGGFPPKFGVIMGQPGVGKNMLLAGMIRAQLEADLDLNIGLFALEDGSRWLVKRWVAMDLGIPLSHVGVVKRTPELIAKLAEWNPRYYDLLKRVQTYRWRRIGCQEMLHISRGWIHQNNVREILFDNLTHLDTKSINYHQKVGQQQRWHQSEKRNEAVAEAVERFAELADTKEIPIIALAHTVRPESEKHDARPPRLSEVADSSGIERVVRFAAGMWRTKARDLRLTIQKNTEGPGIDVTIELERIVEAATIEPSGGRLVNLEQEAREERESRETQKDERTEARRKKKAEKKASEKAAADAKAKKEEPEPKKEAPQLTLIEGGGEKPPEEPKA